MKICINLRGMCFVLILGLLIFTGCAEKKSVVTSDTGQGQQVTSEPPTQQQETMASKEKSESQDVTSEKSVDLEKMARMKSPVSDINFDYDSSSINANAREILKASANYFMKNRISSIIIEGHCDERGTAEYNMALGERRAQETKKYLVNLGIKESIMKTVSFGEENPLNPDSNEDAWAANRRAHFVVNP
jgi:peptidoglycan-associated lipoprotein